MPTQRGIFPAFPSGAFPDPHLLLKPRGSLYTLLISAEAVPPVLTPEAVLRPGWFQLEGTWTPLPVIYCQLPSHLVWAWFHVLKNLEQLCWKFLNQTIWRPQRRVRRGRPGFQCQLASPIGCVILRDCILRARREGVCDALVSVTGLHTPKWYSWFYFPFACPWRYQKMNHLKAGNTCWAM